MSIVTPEQEPARAALPDDTRGLPVVAVIGPTAVGKTSLAERLALALGGEIVSADSMQVYRRMDVGTAKPVESERTVRYHCLDLVEPGADYSAALFQRDARAAIADIATRGAWPILAGGTGLYVRAALDDMRFPGGDTGSVARRQLEDLATEIGAHAMHARLAEIDPASATVIHPNNLRRTIRALEMAALGDSYATQAAGFSARIGRYDSRFVGLTMRREVLYRHIDARVDGMLADGLLDEVRALLDAGFRDALTAGQAIGYKEFVPVVEQGADLGLAVETVKRSTRRYAKRQLTWFRADPRISWIDVTELSPGEVTDRALKLIESGTPMSHPIENET